MIETAQIEEAAQVLREAAPGATVILIGSYARGDARSDSDVDFLVVMPQVRNRYAEMVRLTESLRSLHLPVDVVVLSRERFEYWRKTPNTLANRAIKEGKIYGQVA